MCVKKYMDTKMYLVYPYQILWWWDEHFISHFIFCVFVTDVVVFLASIRLNVITVDKFTRAMMLLSFSYFAIIKYSLHSLDEINFTLIFSSYFVVLIIFTCNIFRTKSLEKEERERCAFHMFFDNRTNTIKYT